MMLNKLFYIPLTLLLILLPFSDFTKRLIDDIGAVSIINMEPAQNTNYALRVPLDKGRISFDVYFVDIETSSLAFYHKDAAGKKIKNIQTLKANLDQQAKKLVFATNGGMYQPNHDPMGLYVEDGKVLAPLNKKIVKKPFTNFYNLPPNGVFYIQQNNDYGIVPRSKYSTIKQVKFATQSGPMVVLDGKINKRFKSTSKSKYIRSGVGIKKNGKIANGYEMIFVISNEPVTFYDFARIFLFYGCEQALYLDGAISEMYLSGPKGPIRTKTYNDFASIIAVTEKK